jgi:predicted O-methyltransferase YrrM
MSPPLPPPHPADIGRSKMKEDWHSGSSAHWRDWFGRFGFFAPSPPRSLRYLEVGTYEGRSVLWVAAHSRADIVGVDINVADVRATFLHNLAQNNLTNRVRFLNGASLRQMAALAVEGALFDAIYVDAAHDFKSVAMDSFAAWQLLRAGGLLIWDGRVTPRRSADPPSPPQTTPSTQG